MRELTRFEALTFDCYGTLIDWESGLWAALEPWLAGQGAEVGRDEALVAFGRHESAQEAETPGLLYREILQRVHRRLATEWGLESSDEAAAAFGRSVRDWPAFPDSSSALQSLSRRFKLAILSNIDRQSFAFSQRVLGVEFDAVFTAEEIGSYKPDRRNFDALIAGMGRLGVAPDSILHTAQSVYHDIIPARRAGLATCWIDRRADRDGWGATPAPAEAAEPDFRFRTLGELADAVAPLG